MFDVCWGDANDSNKKDLKDIVYLIDALYIDDPKPIPVTNVGDTDYSEEINVFIAVMIIKFLYGDEPRPSCYRLIGLTL